ncbi:thiamine-phosphate kinase [Wenzhouxiangella sp. XN24]|uniref:thiamine-phosphate kinase n=1 Tax=Wenzhouxiangella sp. XN24 TaxID=2713569 RepID=UPI0013EBBF58|nr:thiamine-phosphate kinase [Wenzhouxiangella sp. XN24]
MSRGEFDLIARLVAAVPIRRRDVLAGPGDDAALLRPPPDCDLVQTIDTCLEGVHFPVGMPPADVGWRSLAVNLSDLAAMGAMPAWGLLSLAMPRADDAWLDEFARGVGELAQAFGLDLVGGDTVRGPLAVSFALTGFVPSGEALRRRGAAPGDGIWVTGALGGGAAGLAAWQRGEADAAAAFLRPQPRLLEGAALRGIASAAIDVSDGLAQDLGHVLESSGVGAVLDLEDIPIAAAAAAHGASTGEAMALRGGDDYELCFTVPPSRDEELQRVATAWPVAPSRIGVITAGPGLECCRDGRAVQVPGAGWDHFGATAS